MATTYNLAPIPFWNILDNLGDQAANGFIYTYKDTARTTPKAVYADPSGVLAYDNPIPLDGEGRAGPFYWASDENYYLNITDKDGLTIKTVPHFNAPSAGGSGPVTIVNTDDNLVDNGQFRFNESSIANSDITANTALKIAEGGWEYLKTTTTGTVAINFTKFNLGDATPEATPIYYLNYVCSSPATGDSKNDIRFFWKDVRIFEQQEITISFDGISSSLSQIEVFLVQHFGSGAGASADIATSIGSFALTASWDKYSDNSFTVPSVGGKTIGADGGDGVYLAFRMPLDAAANISLVNIKFQLGNKVTPYVCDPYNRTVMETMGGQLPIPTTKSDLLLPVIMGTNGFDFDRSVIGRSYLHNGTTAPSGFFEEDGRKLKRTDSSSEGIPYQRLFDVISYNFGTGDDHFSSTTGAGKTNEITHLSNAAGSVTAATVGTTSFTVTNVAATTSGFVDHFTAQYYGSNKFTLELTDKLIRSEINKGDTTFVVTEVNANPRGSLASSDSPKPVNNRWEIETTVATSLAGKYFVIDLGIPSPVTNGYYVWFRVSGSGSDPARPGTGIQVDLLTTDTAADVARKIFEKLTGRAIARIDTVAASSITAGQYYTVSSTSESFYVWFKKGGSGTDPAVGGHTGIEVDLDPSDTNAQVATKITEAVNSYYFQIPDSRGYFIRGNDGIDQLPRFGAFPYRTSGVGSYQKDAVLAHYHKAGAQPVGADGGSEIYGVIGSLDSEIVTFMTGSAENVPHNISKMIIIKY